MNDPSHIVWNVNPILLDLGPLQIRWYGLLFAAGFLAGFFIMQWIFRRENKPEEDLDRLLIYVALGAVIGARLGHVLFYDPVWFFTHPTEIIKVWHGGLASHGGGIGLFLALWLYARKRPNQPYLWLLDRMALPVALGGSFIRLGNLFNSEILGRPADVPWAIIFARIDPIPRHPVQLYESFAYLTIFVMLFLVYRRLGARTPRGLTAGLFLVLVFGWRFIAEFFKIRQAAFGEALPLSMGQFLSIPMIILGIIILARLKPAPQPTPASQSLPKSTPANPRPKPRKSKKR